MPKRPTEISGTYGRLTVQHCNLPPRKRVLVKCECGKEFACASYDLRAGKTSSCGATLCSTRSSNLIGMTFGFLKVLSLKDEKNDRGELLWDCQCVCGEQHVVKSEHLTNNLVNSCGCKSGTLRSRKLSKPTEQVAINSIWHQYKYGAKNRNLDFSLSLDDVKNFIFKNCHYCGNDLIAEFVIKYITGNKIVRYNGIDRVDAALGYSLTNCVTCCKMCNAAKSDYSVTEFLDWAKQLIKHQSGK